MAIKPYYTSNTLIDAVKRNMSFPIAQVTFSTQEILNFANEEMFLAQVPSILQFHEEYLVYTQEVALATNKSRYPIPGRAIGMKLRDVFFKDNSGQLIEMTKVNPDDKSSFLTSSNSSSTPVFYYLENNHMVITPDVGPNPQGSIQFSYYLRPNSLVPDEQAAVCSSFSKIITVDNTTLVAGDIISFNGLTITAGTEFVIGVNSSTTATNIAAYMNTITDDQFSLSASSNLITVSYEERNTTITASNTVAFSVQATITINCPLVPTEITGGSLIDFLQTEGGHSTYSFDVKVGQNAVSSNSLTFTDAMVPEDFVVGDYICLQYQCIVPQVPTDLHNLLAERTCARILGSLGDQEGLRTANAKIEKLEISQATILDNRVEGSPQKIFNRHSLLRYGKRRGY
jgi:hypothetical protein